MDQSIEKQCNLFEELFQQAVTDLKTSLPIWEDFANKGTRLHGALKTTVTCVSSFLESFQKVADMASGTKGSNKEIGSALTRLCLRHRSIESKMKTFTSSLMENMITPLQEHLEEWKKSVAYMDREHKQENKKAQNEFRRANSEATKLQKKLKKGKSDICESALRDANDKLLMMREVHLTSAKGMLVEERSRLCYFVSCLKPFMDQEICLLSEVTHLQEIIDNLCELSSEPNVLSMSGQQMIRDMIGSGGPLPIAPQHSRLSTSATNVGTANNSHSSALESSSCSSLHSNPHSNLFERSLSQSSHDRNLDNNEIVNGGYNSYSLNKYSQRWSQRINESMPVEMEMANNEKNKINIESHKQKQQQLNNMHEQMIRINSQSTRPHTISSAFERGLPQRTSLSPTTFVDQQKIYSSSRSITRTNDCDQKSGGYAVPCTTSLNIKRQSSYGSDTKVADIYARP